MNTKTMTAICLAAAGAFCFTGCEVKQTEEGKLPDVDVDVKEGNLPKYDVDAGDIDVGTKEVTVDVPTIDVDTPAEDEAEDGGE